MIGGVKPNPGNGAPSALTGSAFVVLAMLCLSLAQATVPQDENKWVLTERMRETQGQAHYNYSTSFDSYGPYVVVGSTSENLFRGVAKIYHDRGRGLLLEAIVTDPDGVIHDDFGQFVRLFRQYGAYHVAVAATGKDSDGAVFIYKENNAKWELQRILTPPTGVYVERFGRSIHFDGDQLLVSAVSRYISSKRFEVGALNIKGTRYFYEADGVSPLPCDPIFVYRTEVGRKNSTRLGLHQTLQDGPYTADFGASISLSGNQMAVGSPFRREVIFGHGNDGDLVVKSGEVKLLDGAAEYNFNNVVIYNGGTLTVERFESLRGAGGILTLKVKQSLTIYAGGAINLTSIGYEGGKTHFQVNGLAEDGKGPGAGKAAKSELIGPASCDYDGSGTLSAIVSTSAQSQRTNSSRPFAEACGGGGGYGTAGRSGTLVQCGDSGLGGGIYGDSGVSDLLRGSGGGAGHAWKVGSGGGGGTGGGAIYIAARVITNYGSIEANGGHGESGAYYSGGGGGAAGGTIILRGVELANYGRITATGGRGGQRAISNGFGGDGSAKGGDGGFGRIRFDFLITRSNGLVSPRPLNVTTFQGDVYLYQKSLVTKDWSLQAIVPKLHSMRFIGHSVALEGNKLAIGSDEGTDVQPVQSVFLINVQNVKNSSSPITPTREIHPPNPKTDRSFGYNLALNNNSLVITASGSIEFPGVVYVHMGRNLYDPTTTTMTTLKSEKSAAGDFFGSVISYRYPELFVQYPMGQDDDIVLTTRLNTGDIHLYKHVRNISASHSMVTCDYATVTANTTVNCTVKARDRYGFACGDLGDLRHFQAPFHLDFKLIGDYSFQYVARDVGTHELIATYKHARFQSFFLTVTPRIVPEKTNFSCTPLRAEAGKPFTCLIHTSAKSGEANAAAYFDVAVYNIDDPQLATIDTYTKNGMFRSPKSNFIIRDPLAFDFVVQNPTVTFVRKGVYSFTFTPDHPGTYAAFAAYQLQALQFPNPFIVDSLPGRIATSVSTLVCPSIAAVGRTVVCIVQLKSSLNVITGGPELARNFSSPRYVTTTLDGRRMNTSVAVWANEGRYAILVKPSRPGQLRVTANYFNLPIAGSPATVTIRTNYPQSCAPTSRVFNSWTIMNQHTQGRSDINLYGRLATRSSMIDGKGLCDDPFI